MCKKPSTNYVWSYTVRLDLNPTVQILPNQALISLRKLGFMFYTILPTQTPMMQHPFGYKPAPPTTVSIDVHHLSSILLCWLLFYRSLLYLLYSLWFLHFYRLLLKFFGRIWWRRVRIQWICFLFSLLLSLGFLVEGMMMSLSSSKKIT